ncbi:hypothetical protein [Calidithermus chliarophilus]|uniref:hypothetical protein n=1 Tax=Calidithermus chliarophilus TaxID=52023 RepID=UPI0012F6A724|nr:hypothetical protein [Calidithermus chliarophilus]
MNKIAFRVLGACILAAALTACPGGGGGSASQGSGKLQNWPSSSTGKLEFYTTFPTPQVLRATANVDASGNFSYSLPNIPATELGDLGSPGSCAPSSNPSAKAANISGTGGIVAYVGAASSPTGIVFVLSFSPSASTLSAGDHLLVGFVFVNSDVTVVGTCTSGGLTTVYDLKFKAGWNLFIQTVEEVSGGTVTKTRMTASTGPLPASLKWWYVPATASLSSVRPKPASGLWESAW